MKGIALQLSTSLLFILCITFIASCSKDEEEITPLFVKPSLPEYAVGVISNDAIRVKFTYTITPSSDNRRLQVSEDTAFFDLRFFEDSQDGGQDYLALTFFWNERTGKASDGKVRLDHYNSDIQVEIPLVPVDMEVLNFERDIEKKEVSFDFTMKTHSGESDLELPIAITGAIKFKNFGDP